MDPYELIMKKRDGKELTDEELKHIVHAFTDEELPDYQMSAFLMTVWFNGLNSRERATLTREMVETGLTLSYDESHGTLVDKHSTGGVGDGVSLPLVPLVASFDVQIPMMSGRGLGHTGGTLDKLESIPGFQVEYDQEGINRALDEVGALIMGQTGEVAPADRKMYALRDVTATVDSVDLIAGSIMSKKIAEGMDSLVLDVKTGAGAFMKEYDKSVELARAMVEIGTELGKNMSALITDMNQPLGFAVGNAIEMEQAIDILKGEGPADLTELVSRLAGEMLVMGDRADSAEDGYRKAHDRLTSGGAVDKLREIIEFQSGDPTVVDDYSLFESTEHETVVESSESGYVQSLNAFEVGMASKSLGAGRETMEDELDYGAGVVLEQKVGDRVEEGQPLARLLYNSPHDPGEARDRVSDAFEIGAEKPERRPLVYSSMDESGEVTELEVPRPTDQAVTA
jgi:pyrimidine-nucleoside phosphorylase